MKKPIFLTLLCWFAFSPFIMGQSSSARNIAGFGVAFIPSLEHGIYFDDPWDFFPNREPSYMVQASYARQLNQSFRTGLYVEYERIRFTDNQNNNDVRSFKRYNLGLDWIGQYPSTALHMQLGGYMGCGFLMANNWDNLFGFDFGLIAGPAYETGHIGISAQVRSGFASYSSSGIPSGVLLYCPKILFKVYYRF
jgi:hypothetical protein